MSKGTGAPTAIPQGSAVTCCGSSHSRAFSQHALHRSFSQHPALAWHSNVPVWLRESALPLNHAPWIGTCKQGSDQKHCQQSTPHPETLPGSCFSPALATHLKPRPPRGSAFSSCGWSPVHLSGRHASRPGRTDAHLPRPHQAFVSIKLFKEILWSPGTALQKPWPKRQVPLLI